jgi:hypothetical protein
MCFHCSSALRSADRGSALLAAGKSRTVQEGEFLTQELARYSTGTTLAGHLTLYHAPTLPYTVLQIALPVSVANLMYKVSLRTPAMLTASSNRNSRTHRGSKGQCANSIASDINLFALSIPALFVPQMPRGRGCVMYPNRILTRVVHRMPCTIGCYTISSLHQSHELCCRTALWGSVSSFRTATDSLTATSASASHHCCAIVSSLHASTEICSSW